MKTSNCPSCDQSPEFGFVERLWVSGYSAKPCKNCGARLSETPVIGGLVIALIFAVIGTFGLMLDVNVAILFLILVAIKYFQLRFAPFRIKDR